MICSTACKQSLVIIVQSSALRRSTFNQNNNRSSCHSEKLSHGRNKSFIINVDSHTFADNEFSALLNKEFRPKSDDAKTAIESAVKTLAEQALAQRHLISDDSLQSISAIIAEIDKKLTEQINKILHHEDFQKLESAWRGLHYLVNNTETDETLKIRVFNISKSDVAKTLKKYKGTAWDQSPIFKKIYEEEYGQFGGEPYGCLVADYYFDHSPPDVAVLQEMMQICAASHTPLITGTAPTVLQLESWQQLNDRRDLTKIFGTPEYAAWRSLREAEDSRYLGLCMPRFLARLPYGSKTDPVSEFDFEEDATGGEHSKYCWANAAYAMATNITRSFKSYGWCTSIRGIESVVRLRTCRRTHSPPMMVASTQNALRRLR